MSAPGSVHGVALFLFGFSGLGPPFNDLFWANRAPEIATVSCLFGLPGIGSVRFAPRISFGFVRLDCQVFLFLGSMLVTPPVGQ